jgi:hypothetical protein
VNTDDFRTLYKNFGKPGGQDHGDFDHNGVVDFADFQIMELWFGRSASDKPFTVSAADQAALNAFAQTAPEPAALLPVLMATLLLRRRRC